MPTKFDISPYGPDDDGKKYYTVGGGNTSLQVRELVSEMNKFKDLINSTAQMLVEENERESKAVDERMKSHGYGNPQPGADGHITFTKETDDNDQMLIDVPGGEWHHMTKGVINKVGQLDDDSLETYLKHE